MAVGLPIFNQIVFIQFYKAFLAENYIRIKNLLYWHMTVVTKYCKVCFFVKSKTFQLFNNATETLVTFDKCLICFFRPSAVGVTCVVKE